MTARRQRYITWLVAVLLLVLCYSLLLVVAGATAGSLFSWFGFGPAKAIDTPAVREYLRLPYMVLGAVMAGWSFLMMQIVRGPL
jgi:peptidoglycan/LPS O-acetylase OafA/YrhL